MFSHHFIPLCASGKYWPTREVIMCVVICNPPLTGRGGPVTRGPVPSSAILPQISEGDFIIPVALPGVPGVRGLRQRRDRKKIATYTTYGG